MERFGLELRGTIGVLKMARKKDSFLVARAIQQQRLQQRQPLQHPNKWPLLPSA
jgi:hypothetical protein